MTTRKITTIVCISAIVILAGYDVWAYYSKNDSTISIVVWMWSHGNPIVPFLGGLLCGHWFAPPYPRSEIK